MNDQRPRVLILSGNNTNPPGLVDALSPFFQIDVFDTPDKAIVALRNEMYACIFSDVGDYLPLERSLFDRQASLILNTIGEGVCIVDDTGVCIWANNKMKTFPPAVYDRVKKTCISAQTLFSEQVSPVKANEKSKTRSKKYGFQVGKDNYYEMFVSPVIDDQHNIQQVVAVVWDASSGRRLQQKIDALDAAGRELVRLESEAICKMNVGQRLKLLEDKIIRYTSDLLHFDHFCIRLLNKRTNRLELVMSKGLPQEALDVDLYAQPEGNGISGYVAATGRSYICHDVEKDPRYVLGLSHAKSSLTVPLRLHDKIIGIFNIESQTPGSFNEDDRQFAEIFARNVAVALNILDLLVVERYTTTGRLADNVTREIAAPLNDIVTEIQNLINDYIGDDHMGEKLGNVLDYVEQIRESIKQVSGAPKTIIGTDEIKATADPYITGKRILVADDESKIRNTMNDVLTKLGGKVFVAKDGHEAVTVIDREVLDLVISDIRMPLRNGYEIFGAAQRKDATLPVILMTGFGYDPHHSVVRASQEGLHTVLFKPFKINQMLTEVRKALGATDEQASPDESQPKDSQEANE